MTKLIEGKKKDWKHNQYNGIQERKENIEKAWEIEKTKQNGSILL